MGYFGKQVGQPVVVQEGAQEKAKEMSQSPAKGGNMPLFAGHVGKAVAKEMASAGVDRCPLCQATLHNEDGFARCGGRHDGGCGRRWVCGGAGRWLDPATLPFGVCDCCSPRVPLVSAEVGAICPNSRVEYLILPEGILPKTTAAPLGVCRCCLPPQPLVKLATGLVCRAKPQQHYQVVKGEVVWVGLAPAADQAAVTAAIDAALRANNAELTLFGLFSPPTGERATGR